MALIDKKTAHVLFTVLLFAAVLALAFAARKMLIIFLFAMLFAYLLEPVVSRVQSWVRNSRIRAIAVVYLLLVILVIIFLSTAGPRIVQEGQKLSQSLPALSERIGSGQIAFQIGQKRGWSQETSVRVQQFLVEHRVEVLSRVQTYAGQAAAYAPSLGWIVMVPILAFFLLKDKSEFANAALDLIDSRREQKFLRGIMNDVDVMLAKYIRAQLLLAILGWIAYTAFLWIMRVPYTFILAAIAGVLEFIPFVGPLITAVLILTVSFFSGYPHWLAILIFILIWRGVQDYVNAPYVMGEGLELHPLATIFGILVGGEVAGVVGMFLSIPILAALRIVWHNWRRHQAVKDQVKQGIDELAAQPPMPSPH
jgi:predicted PurR-regulated permease PerM